ncbi:MAG: cbb3-type cytochrome c oxidase subunit 3 [Emcibacteraceae bacterium]
MDINHETLVAISKSYGLFYMMIVFIGVTVYAYWPANKNKFDQAGESILKDEDNHV